MRKAASWRGSAIATPKREFTRLLRVIRPTKKDVFYDLGCGYGRLCIWIAPKVKLAIGFENHFDRYRRAKLAVERSGVNNVQIRYADFGRASYKNATIIYSIVDVGLRVMGRIDRQCEHGAKFVQYWRPNYPLKGKRILGDYFLMKTPFQRVKDENEFARIYLGRKKKATIEDMYAHFGKEDRTCLKREIRESRSSWERFFFERHRQSA
jgi:SAM-dependent methyltransferase